MSHKVKTLLILFCVMMAVLFGGLAVWSWGTGTKIWKDNFREAEVAKKKPEKAHGRFSLTKKQVLSMSVAAPGLDDSWVWTKAIIVDSKDRPVVDLEFNIEYYTGDGFGENWQEGSRATSRPFALPAGDYKVLLYAEDAKRSTRWTDPQDVRIRASIEKGVVVSKYFEILFVIFAIGTVLMMFVGAED